MSEQNTAHGDPMPDAPETHPFDGQFEPPAEAVAKGNPFIPLPEIAQASIAISLKRLADVAEKLTDNDAHISLTNLVQHLAWEAGRSFQHGTRTDR